MSTTIAMKVGETKTVRMTIFQSDGVTRQNLTGAKLYLAATRNDGTPIWQKDNDLSGGVTLLAQSGLTEGQADAKVEPADTASEAVAANGLYQAWVRLDPSGDDDRHNFADGKYVLEAQLVVIP